MIDPSLTFEQLHENIMWILKVGKELFKINK